jgi:O-antigen/teichoic acid export membrane protein
MSEEKSYRQIFKALSIFGGVQVLVIFFGIIRNKIVAITMGPEGVGKIGLYTTVVTLMIALTSFGIGSSAVKMISEAFHSGDKPEFEKSYSVFSKLTLYTGLGGALLTCLLSPYLSLWTFGNYDSTMSFAILSLVVFFTALDTKNVVLLQGIRNLKDQGKASLYGTAVGTVFCIPLYIFFKEKAIVPSLVLLIFFTMLASYYFAKKVAPKNVILKPHDFKSKSKEFISLGFAMTISYILVYAVSFVVRLYISQQGGVAQVGLYQAGWAIVNGYVGLIFTAMAKDYFPRLASVNTDDEKVCAMANQQIELGLLIISPIIGVFLLMMDKIVGILYSSAFYEIKNMMIWSLVGMFFKLLSWSISYVFLAKGLGKKFVFYEVVNNVVTVLLSIGFYHFWKLEGLGIAFFMINLIYLLIVFYMAKSSFNFTYSYQVKILFVANFIICMGLSFLMRFSGSMNSLLFYILFGIGLFVIFSTSIKGLDNRLSILSLIRKKVK